MADTDKPKHVPVPITRYKGGPHGHGDPNDLSLRRVELDVVIPKKVREKSRSEKCVKQVEDFSNCCADNGLLMTFKCKQETNELKECLTYWFNNKEFVEQCKNEYLNERSEYRRTGIGKKSQPQPLGSKRMQSSM